MKKAAKWVGIVLGAGAGLIAAAGGAIYVATESHLDKIYEIPPETVAIPTDAAAIEQGRHVATIRGCVDCHGPNLGGRVFLEDPAVGRVIATNLTAGTGGIGSRYTDADYIRAVRHGVGPDGKALIIMPSQEFFHLSDEDLGAVIAYLKSLPPVDSNLPETELALPIRALYLLTGDVDLLPAEKIDHAAPRETPPTKAISADYGKYLAVSCIGCHGDGLSGGKIPGVPPSWPAAANLTPGGDLQGWSETDFVKTLRTGITPRGKPLPNEFMPWKVIGQMTDDEIKALWVYLKTMPAMETGNR